MERKEASMMIRNICAIVLGVNMSDHPAVLKLLTSKLYARATRMIATVRVADSGTISAMFQKVVMSIIEVKFSLVSGASCFMYWMGAHVFYLIFLLGSRFRGCTSNQKEFLYDANVGIMVCVSGYQGCRFSLQAPEMFAHFKRQPNCDYTGRPGGL